MAADLEPGRWAELGILCEETNATNPAVLETDEADNIYLVRPDWGDVNWSSNKSYLYRFLSSNDYSKPLITEIPGSVHGKYAMEIDEPRGQLYYSCQQHIPRHRPGRVVRRSVTLLQPGKHAWLQYPYLDLDTTELSTPDGPRRKRMSTCTGTSTVSSLRTAV